MSTIRINAETISDEESFHLAFKTAFGFPDFYGANMNAWIDCMSDLRVHEGAGTMSGKVAWAPGEVLTLEINGVEGFSQRCPEILRVFVECLAAVNCRYRDDNVPPISLVLF